MLMDKKDTALDQAEIKVGRALETAGEQESSLRTKTKGLNVGSVENFAETAAGDITEDFESLTDEMGLQFNEATTNLRNVTSKTMDDIGIQVEDVNAKIKSLNKHAKRYRKWKKFWSDSRLKENVVKVGTSKSGIDIYEYNYIWDSAKYTGVIAQEILDTHPEAVEEQDGYYVVNYDKIDVDFNNANREK